MTNCRRCGIELKDAHWWYCKKCYYIVMEENKQLDSDDIPPVAGRPESGDIHTCLDCSKPIWHGALRCWTCYKKFKKWRE